MNSHSLARGTAQSRALLVRRVREEGWSVAETAEAAGVSERTVYKWLARARASACLADRSSRPHRSPGRTPEELEAWIVRLRKQRMTGPAIARQLRLPRSSVFRVLKRAGLSRLKYLEPAEPVIRYERKHPGSLVHIDMKKLGKIGRPGHRVHGDRRTRVRGIGWEYVHVAIDDASRLAYVEVLDTETGPDCTAFLARTLAWFERHGIRVRAVMTDNGPPYKPNTLFDRFCASRRVRHLFTKPYRPQTNGKAERFIQTLLREWAYARPYAHSNERDRALLPWLRYYNRKRPHGSLNGNPPIVRALNNVSRLHS